MRKIAIVIIIAILLISCSAEITYDENSLESIELTNKTKSTDKPTLKPTINQLKNTSSANN